tara:strand:- start:105 stop:650 length:546 start_codon:yes stop_codon:yes gene_type:complete
MANWFTNQKAKRLLGDMPLTKDMTGSGGAHNQNKGYSESEGPLMTSKGGGSPLHQDYNTKKSAPNYKSVTLSNDEKVDDDGQTTTTHTYIQGGKGNYTDDQGEQKGLGSIHSERFSTQNRIMTQDYKTSPNATASDKRGFRQGGPEVAGADKFDRKSGKMIFGKISDGIKPRGVQRTQKLV